MIREKLNAMIKPDQRPIFSAGRIGPLSQVCCTRSFACRYLVAVMPVLKEMSRKVNVLAGVAKKVNSPFLVVKYTINVRIRLLNRVLPKAVTRVAQLEFRRFYFCKAFV